MAHCYARGYVPQEASKPLHQCGEPLRELGRSNKYYCPKCDMRKAALANSLAGQVVSRWEAVTGHLQEVAQAFEDLTDRASMAESHLAYELQEALGRLWEAAAAVDQAISDTRAGNGGPAEQARPGKSRLSITVIEVFGEGFLP